MGKITLSKQIVPDVNVYEASVIRTRAIFKRFDNVYVSFSGGKDSTVVLNIALMVAKEMNRLPLKVVHFDEEAIHPPTVEYLQRVASNPDIEFKWYCLPLMHRNACSREQPYWYCWNPKEKHLWVRDLPENAITYLKGFKIGMGIPECCHMLYKEDVGTKIILQGIRTEESIRRYRAVSRRVEDNYMSLRSRNGWYFGYPIYDWSSLDVWIGANKFGWDYNKTYDIFMRYGLKPTQQRVCPPYGEEPLRGLGMYKECFPSMWAKMVNRVKGANTASIYANTDLYSISVDNPPEGMTWRDYADLVTDLYSEEDRQMINSKINRIVKLHYYKSTKPIHETKDDPITGISWKWICKMVLRGDYKGRIEGMMSREGDTARKKMGISFEDAIRKFGTPEYIKEFFNQ